MKLIVFVIIFFIIIFFAFILVFRLYKNRQKRVSNSCHVKNHSEQNNDPKVFLNQDKLICRRYERQIIQRFDQEDNSSSEQRRGAIDRYTNSKNLKNAVNYSLKDVPKDSPKSNNSNEDFSIIKLIRDKIDPGMLIPKPEAKKDFFVKGWGRRRGEKALVYFIPNRINPNKPYEKGISESEFTLAFKQLMEKGCITRVWFKENIKSCNKEGGCNYTTIGGVFEILGLATYSRGSYIRVKNNKIFSA